jgi:hypothetical protein
MQVSEGHEKPEGPHFDFNSVRFMAAEGLGITIKKRS